MAIEGPLKELSVQDVLQLLNLARKTGVLTVRSERQRDEAVVHFERGAIVFAARRKANRQLGQQLLRAGKVTEREVERALEIQRQNPSRGLADILLEMGSVDEQDLEHHLRFILEETLYDVLAWDEGYFRFEEREEVTREQGPVRVQVRVESLLMEGARRIDEWARLEAKVPSVESVPVLAAPVEGSDQGPLDLHPSEWEVLAEIAGERDIRQIAADLGRSTFDVAKTVYGLVSTGVVQVLERPARLPEQELQAAVEEVERLVEAGELERAERLATELQTAYPERAELALLVGRVYAAEGRMRAATEAFSLAAGLEPLLPEAHYHLGFAAVRIGELERAARAWDAFLRISGGDSRRPLVAEGLEAVQALNRVLEKAMN
jgi:tetratricopeptide (TPR) repeat protein